MDEVKSDMLFIFIISIIVLLAFISIINIINEKILETNVTNEEEIVSENNNLSIIWNELEEQDRKIIINFLIIFLPCIVISIIMIIIGIYTGKEEYFHTNIMWVALAMFLIYLLICKI